MKRARVFFWKLVPRTTRRLYRWALLRGAKACGCDDCKLVYDATAQEAAAKVAAARIFEALKLELAREGKPADRRPS